MKREDLLRAVGEIDEELIWNAKSENRGRRSHRFPAWAAASTMRRWLPWIASSGEHPGMMAFAPPEYPASARRRNIEGWVKVRFIVNTHGQPEQIKILAADPRDVFEANAERAVQGWRFRPGTVNGEVVRVLVEQTIRFQLR